MNDFLEWALGYGYIRVRADLNRAEEAALLVAPLNRLIAEAARDELRLRGSNIDNREDLLDQLHRATSILVSAAGVSAGVVPTPAMTGLALAPRLPAREGIHRRDVQRTDRPVSVGLAEWPGTLTCASLAPSSLRAYARSGRFRVNAASSPCSTNWWRTR